jgi:Holliday junction resolvase-like predicted endonuclease
MLSMSTQPSVWDLVRQFAEAQRGTWKQEEIVSWFRRHAPDQAKDGTVRAHVRGAAWNVGDRSQFAGREPFLTRVDTGWFRMATAEELARWRDGAAIAAATPETTAVTEPGANMDVDPASWHTEENVQRLLVERLTSTGWTILRTANTATGETGIDVVAERNGETVGIEVKGYPSKVYARGAKKGQPKRTSPSTQAAHWFSHAILAAMKLRVAQPAWQSVMAFPDFPRYRKLHTATAAPLAATGIEVWLVSEEGTIEPLE